MADWKTKRNRVAGSSSFSPRFGGKGGSAGKAVPANSSSGAGLGNMNRQDFLKVLGTGAAALGAASMGLSSAVRAQVPQQPPANVVSELLALAAVVDTVVPTSSKTNVPVIGPSGQPVGQLSFAGSSQTQTSGAVDFPASYLYLYQLLPLISHEPSIVSWLSAILDQFAKMLTQNPQANFQGLDYDTRYQILYLMDKPEALVPILLQNGYPMQEAINAAAQAKQLITPVVYLTFFIYYSEVCNVVPAGTNPDTGLPLYNRNPDNSWSILPGSAWEQLKYPGPSYKEPSYASTYSGLRVTIADGKVKIQ